VKVVDMKSDSRPAVAVVGAGLAGLAAAWDLARRGCAVTVLERAQQPGGRARSESVDGFTLEAAGPLVSTGDKHLLAWIDALGIRDELLPLRPAVTMHWRAGVATPIDARGMSGVRRIPGVRTLEALRLVRFPRLLSRYGERLRHGEPESGSDLDDRSLGDFARLYFGTSVLDNWMGPFATSASLGDADQLSRVYFLRRFCSHGGSRPGLLRSGLGEIAEAAASKLAVKTGTEVIAIERTPGGMLIRVEDGRRARDLTPDAVVLATSAADACRIAAPSLVSAERDGLGFVKYQRAISLAVGLRRAFFSHPQHILVARGSDEPIESIVLEPGVHGGRVPAGRGLALLRATGAWSGANFDIPEETATKELLAAFARIQRGAEPAVLLSKLFRVERALPRFEVGRYREIARFERVQRDLRGEGRRLYFAGDYLMDPSLEGALASGFRAAAAVAEDLAGA
jgi:protoporphyrinogen oxidase